MNPADNRKDDKPHKRGHGTDKMPVIGAIERGGKVTAQAADKLTFNSLRGFIRDKIQPDETLLITDEYSGYNRFPRSLNHAVINHSVQYADGETHINTIEGFWALLKCAWFGSHHNYTRKHADAYSDEACYKYNVRN